MRHFADGYECHDRNKKVLLVVFKYIELPAAGRDGTIYYSWLTNNEIGDF